MSEYVIPPSMAPNEAELRLIDYSAAQTSALSGATRTLSRGQRWEARLMWHDVTDAKRAALSTLMARFRGKSNRVWVADPAYKPRGSFPVTEMLNDPTMSNAANWDLYGSGWIYAGNNEMVVIAAATTAYGFSQPVTLQAAQAYVLRSCIVDGYNSSAASARLQVSSAGGTSFVLPDLVANRGLLRLPFTSNAFGIWTIFPIMMQTGIVINQAMLNVYASLERCALVINPSTAAIFNSCRVDALPVNQQNILLAGDRIEINGEFKTVTSDLNSDALGSGPLMFEPPMRKVYVPDNSAVIVGTPMMKGILSSDAVQPSRPGPTPFSDFDFTFTEAT